MLNSHHKDQIKRAVGKTKQGVIYAEIIFLFFFFLKETMCSTCYNFYIV